MSVDRKLDKGAPYRLLALDGGGIRGLITLEMLAAMERELADAHGRDASFVLADYFDYIAGTSTGAIIATCLSLGWRVDRIRQFYLDAGAEMFDKANLLERFRYKFTDTTLAAMLHDVLGASTTLGDARLRTLLLVVLRNATTDSPWPLTNNPRAKYNNRARPDCNLDLPLWQVVRASTAAPTFFPPETIEIGPRRFVFVDGGVTMYNNPAFQLFLMATVAPYQLGWPTGDDRMLLVSVGTGTSPDANENLAPHEMNLLYNASSIPSALMLAASTEQDVLCRVFGRLRYGSTIDREVGDLSTGDAPTHPKLFSYIRYNVELTKPGLTTLGLADIEPGHVQQMDSVGHLDDLRRVGEAAARAQVRVDHFRGFIGG